MLAFLDVVARYRPRWVVWENVPGVLHSGRGRDFAAFIGGLVERGYCCAWRVLDAQFFGVPQRRRRVFVVGCFGDWERAAAVLFERAGVRGHFEPRRTAGEDIATLNASRAGTQSGGMTLCMAHGQGGAEIRIDSSPTLTCNHEAPIVVNGRQDPCVSDTAFTLGCQHNGTDNVLLGGHALRRLTPRECERLQGMPGDHTRIPWRGKAAEACPDSPRYAAIGNSMAVPVMRWIGERIQQVEVMA